MSAPLPRSVVLGYGLGSLGTGMYSTVPGLLLLYYLTDVLGVAAGLAGVAIFLPKIWDVVTDPAMGHISDRTRSRWGRRRPYLLAGGFALPLCFGLLFSAPDVGAGPAFAYTLVIYTLCATAYTVFQVPYIAMPAEMTADYHETTRLMAYRMAFMTLGILIAGAGAPILIKQFGGGRAAYSVMSWAVAGVCMAAMLGSFLGTRRAAFSTDEGEVIPIPEQLRLALRNRPFMILLGAYFLQLCAIGGLLAVVPYFAKYVVGGGEETVTILFLALMLPAIVTMPAWLALSKRLGKERSYRLALVLFTAASLLLWGSASLPFAAVAGLVAVMGIAYAATQLFPFSMLPDTIAVDQAATGRRREGIFTGIWTAVDKGGLAFGALLASLVLGGSGFVESRDGALATQPESALAAIVLAMSLIPAALTAACWLALRGYRLDQGQLAALKAEESGGR